ncbi:hypothetical protein [Accumulibacter sp.]|nr:hypothetical protein [Accumulibacter sp.]MCM8595579.1 hypothetical protein [Accumulibacter sp.]MCM8625533.1 hypothetical protein [Accumulibacter sp.]MDS4049727.1 hypothetical protein [Accumulibacter sp.]
MADPELIHDFATRPPPSPDRRQQFGQLAAIVALVALFAIARVFLADG